MNAVRVLERDGRVRVVEAAAVRAELLDRDLRRGRAARDRLLARPRASSRSRARRTSATTPCETSTTARIERERQQDVDERPVEVDPEVAERRRRAAREAADHRGEHGHPERGRDEVLHREPGHLAQVRHRVLAAVVLPVRVRDEARGRVHRDVRVTAGEAVRVQRQVVLQAQQQVEQHREDAHEDERRCARTPSSPARVRPRPDQAVEAALGRGEPARDAERRRRRRAPCTRRADTRAASGRRA